ncbi:RNA polymerase sigma factor [Ningiella sp. W23]|uniref:RNA polymerase sigma factor n=1 Tax=Ningiella sp. W23 TaxID=3023715 RepID=UPI003757F276
MQLVQDSESVHENSAYQASKDEELGLVRLAQQGDTIAYRKLYDLHVARVYGLCFRLCADKSQAEDAAQEVFIQLWQKMQNFKGESKFSTYLHAVASNVCISYIRKQRSWWQKMFSIDDSTQQECAGWGDYCEDEFEKLVLQLPQRMRHVFILYAVEGYRHEQIAENLGISVSTSKVQYHKAKNLLEAAINE